jgi:hypothetical protein
MLSVIEDFVNIRTLYSFENAYTNPFVEQFNMFKSKNENWMAIKSQAVCS